MRADNYRKCKAGGPLQVTQNPLFRALLTLLQVTGEIPGLSLHPLKSLQTPSCTQEAAPPAHTSQRAPYKGCMARGWSGTMPGSGVRGMCWEKMGCKRQEGTKEAKTQISSGAAENLRWFSFRGLSASLHFGGRAINARRGCGEKGEAEKRIAGRGRE